MKLTREVPAPEDQELVLVGEDGGGVASSWLWRVPHGGDLLPLEFILHIQLVDVVEGCPLVVHSSMSSEDVHFALVVSGRVVGSGLRCSNFRPGVLRLSNRLLVGWLEPLEVNCVTTEVRVLRQKVSLNLVFDV